MFVGYRIARNELGDMAGTRSQAIAHDLAHRIRGEARAFDQRDSGAKDFPEDGSKQRVMGAAQDQSIEFRSFGKVMARQNFRFRRLRQAFLNNVDK
jgi:hypothetical protein